MIHIKNKSKNKYTFNDKLIIVKKGVINYLGNFSNLEKETFVKYYNNLMK